MNDRILFFLNRLRERLWFKPLFFSILSVASAFLAKTIDLSPIAEGLPTIAASTNITLLTIMASSMLVIATFAVASMVSSYASASNTATPRSFPLIVADDSSQTALSTFVGACIYSVVTLASVLNDYYTESGHLIVFVVTMSVFAVVIITFVYWVDKIARLGRLDNVVGKVEDASQEALTRRAKHPTMQAAEVTGDADGVPVRGIKVGYIQRIDIERLQEIAIESHCRITVAALPGAFASLDRILATVKIQDGGAMPDKESIAKAFEIGNRRVFDEDPRFGLIVLSEIAQHALSPALNDPGTAIYILGACVRLMTNWSNTQSEQQAAESKGETYKVKYDRVAVPRLNVDDLFDDAFSSIERDGAILIEVQVCLQKVFASLKAVGNGELSSAALKHSQRALLRAQNSSLLKEEIDAIQTLASAVRSVRL